MSESVALLAQIDQAPKTANDEDVDFSKDNMTGNDADDHAVFSYDFKQIETCSDNNFFGIDLTSF